MSSENANNAADYELYQTRFDEQRKIHAPHIVELMKLLGREDEHPYYTSAREYSKANRKILNVETKWLREYKDDRFPQFSPMTWDVK